MALETEDALDVLSFMVERDGLGIQDPHQEW
jgi:hypothetical protein